LGQWLERNRKKPETEIESESPLPVPATAAITAINPELMRQKPHRKPIENSQTPLSRAIPARVRSQVWRRDRGKCQNCGSKFGIEIDHIQPFSKNGTHDPENLRLLCKSCNLRAGVKEFGTVKMQR